MFTDAARARLAELCADNRLVRFVPILDRCDAEKRAIYMLPTMDKAIRERLPAVSSHLKQFIIGRYVDDRDYMKRLKPPEDEVWEFHVQMIPEHRVFGRFLSQNCFIAFCQSDRAAVKMAKRRGSPNRFREQMDHVMTEWSRYFPDAGPLVSDNFADYVTQPLGKIN